MFDFNNKIENIIPDFMKCIYIIKLIISYQRDVFIKWELYVEI